MNKPKRRIFSLLSLIALSGLLAACGIFSGSRLEPGGSYAPLPIVTTTNGTVVTNQVAPDFALYATDLSFELAYTSIQTVFKLERDNRALLWKVSPEIKHKLDVIRPQSVDWITRYGLARKAYIASPNPTALSSLQDYTVRLQQLLIAAQAAMPK